MLETEAFSIAARLYVAMRQKLGRITDVQWMLKSPEYAVEIIRLAREQAGSELKDLADKFENVLAAQRGGAPSGQRHSVDSPLAVNSPGDTSSRRATSAHVEPSNEGAKPRYVGRLR